MKYLIIIFLVSVSLSCYSQKQIVLLDLNTLKPIEYATVYDSVNKIGTHSDENGFFIIDCQNSFQISHISYETTYISCENLVDTIYLKAASVLLNTVEVKAQNNKTHMIQGTPTAMKVGDFQKKKVRRKELVEAGVGNGKSKLHYAGIKEAALYIEKPLKRSCYNL